MLTPRYHSRAVLERSKMTSVTSSRKNAVLIAAVVLGNTVSSMFAYGIGAQAATSPPVYHPIVGHNAEMIAPAATITSTVQYQAEIVLTCSSPSQICSGNFHAPGKNRQLHVTQVTCVVGTPDGGHSILYGY